MWPKCCPSFKGATWDQEDFAQLLSFLPPWAARYAFWGMNYSTHFSPFYFAAVRPALGEHCSQSNSLSHTQADISETSVKTQGGNWIFMKGRDPFQPNEHSLSLPHKHTHTLTTVWSHNHTHTRSTRTCSIPAGTYSSHATLHSFISKAHAHYIQQQNTRTQTHTPTPIKLIKLDSSRDIINIWTISLSCCCLWIH